MGPIIALHLVLATPKLPVDDLRLTDKQTRLMLRDEDTFNAVKQQWQGRWFEPWDGESKGIYAE